ncbi:hypothetical protein SAMN05216522_10513 [Rosenbergiella nectarea]|uniref:Phage neck terminator protein gp12-like domain-containing protein n=1 Tax=Rosenbergiella nectarea TaxID=988801 RepID=A0A1H9HQH7_9GAMM|nr:hypothetical protein [Rosenbergiella nectarea]SEQ64482.1 hypothetical protein SAMN05216522_10513 [Rosenbergiella nectarea]
MADQLETVAHSLLSQLSEIPFIRANQNGPRPKLPYATYRINARKAIGSDEYGLVDGSGLMPIVGVREGTILINFFGIGAREQADNLVNSIRKVSSHDLMRKLNLILFAAGSVTDLTALRDSANFEEMANIDVNFRYAAKYSDNVGVIETVDATGEIQGQTIHKTITVKS